MTECCNDCGQTQWCDCPNITLEWCGSIDNTDPNNLILNIPCINIRSWDASISVWKIVSGNEVNYDIRVPNYEDRKVWACFGDSTPWYLFNDKLRVVTTWPLTYNLYNCPWNSYVEIGFDATKLSLPTSAECDCPAWTLDCTVSCSNCNIQPKAMARLVNNTTVVQATGLERNYYLSWVAIPELDALWWYRQPATFDTIWAYWGMTHASWVITVCRDWIYEFSFEWSQEQNKWIHASRVWLLLITPAGSVVTLTQSRYSGTDAYFWSASQPTNPDPSYANYWDNSHTTAYAWASTPDWGTFSMGTVFERLPLHWSRWRPQIEAWSRIVAFTKVSTYITWDNSSDVSWQLSIIWFTNLSAWGDDLFTFSVRNIDTPCECDA
jgi:hypothetical protein